MLRFLSIVAGSIVCASLAHAGPSSFQRSCNDIRIERPAGEVSIGASCRDRAGRSQPAEFDLNGYHNIDGRLVFDGRGKSSFQRSCDAIDIRVNSQRVMLVAQCRARNQSIQPASIEIQDIHNIDGRLVRGNASAQGAPDNVRFCQSYAANAAGIADLAIKKNPACLDYSKGVHNNYKMHYDWCLKQPRSSVQGAENNIRRLAALCSGAGAPAAPQGVFTGGKRLTGNCVGRYQDWQKRPGAKAFAVAMDGKRCGWATGQRSLIEAQTKALNGCGGRADAPCIITEAVR